MKKGMVCLLVVLMSSCVTINDRAMSPEERETAEIVGSVETRFISWQPLHIKLNESIKKKAYSKLMTEARRRYQGNIEVVNITVEGTYSPLSLLYPPGAIVYNFQKIKASGNVILYSIGGKSVDDIGPLDRAAYQTLRNVQQRSKIAIIYITAQDSTTTDYIAEKLESAWTNEGYITIGRSQMDRLRSERHIQISGEIDDETAVSIGRLAGANIIVTGKVDEEGDLRRLRLRALDTQTSQTVGVSSESF